MHLSSSSGLDLQFLKVDIFQPLQMKALIQVHLGAHMLDQAIDPVTNQNTCKVVISPNH